MSNPTVSMLTERIAEAARNNMLHVEPLTDALQQRFDALYAETAESIQQVKDDASIGRASAETAKNGIDFTRFSDQGSASRASERLGMISRTNYFTQEGKEIFGRLNSAYAEVDEKAEDYQHIARITTGIQGSLVAEADKTMEEKDAYPPGFRRLYGEAQIMRITAAAEHQKAGSTMGVLFKAMESVVSGDFSSLTEGQLAIVRDHGVDLTDPSVKQALTQREPQPENLTFTCETSVFHSASEYIAAFESGGTLDGYVAPEGQESPVNRQAEYGEGTFDRNFNGIYRHLQGQPYDKRFDYIFIDGKSVTDTCNKEIVERGLSGEASTNYMKCAVTAAMLKRDAVVECVVPKVEMTADSNGILRETPTGEMSDPITVKPDVKEPEPKRNFFRRMMERLHIWKTTDRNKAYENQLSDKDAATDRHAAIKEKLSLDDLERDRDMTSAKPTKTVTPEIEGLDVSDLEKQEQFKAAVKAGVEPKVAYKSIYEPEAAPIQRAEPVKAAPEIQRDGMGM